MVRRRSVLLLLLALPWSAAKNCSKAQHSCAKSCSPGKDALGNDHALLQRVCRLCKCQRCPACAAPHGDAAMRLLQHPWTSPAVRKINKKGAAALHQKINKDSSAKAKKKKKTKKKAQRRRDDKEKKKEEEEEEKEKEEEDDEEEEKDEEPKRKRLKRGGQHKQQQQRKQQQQQQQQQKKQRRRRSSPRSPSGRTNGTAASASVVGVGTAVGAALASATTNASAAAQAGGGGGGGGDGGGGGGGGGGTSKRHRREQRTREMADTLGYVLLALSLTIFALALCSWLASHLCCAPDVDGHMPLPTSDGALKRHVAVPSMRDHDDESGESPLPSPTITDTPGSLGGSLPATPGQPATPGTQGTFEITPAAPLSGESYVMSDELRRNSLASPLDDSYRRV